MDRPEKMDLSSGNISEEQKAKLKQLFPEVFTEGNKVDFDKLKLTLGETIDAGKERYGMNWPGKAECFKTIQQPSIATLVPAKEESVNFDETENLIIEGDNLEVLKLLQKSYMGKIKLIYIDPPYNTGNDFIYPDNYTESLETYLLYTGQTNNEGKKFSTNTEEDGRFHSKWIKMIYSRLFLARNLLRDDAAIFISIDDGEFSNLKNICNEIFGEENFIATFIWEKRTTRENRKIFSFNHDYVISYAKNSKVFQEIRGLLPYTKEALERYSNPDNDPRGDWQSVSLSVQGGHGTSSQFYKIKTPSGRSIDPPSGLCWRFTNVKLQELIKENRIWFGPDGNNVPRLKLFLSESNDGLTPHTLWKAEEVGTTDIGKKELLELFDGKAVFDTVKPISLIQRILQIATKPNDSEIVLDFFAGSGSLGHAVLDMNKNDGGNRKYILAQLPEPCLNESEAFKNNLQNISDITKERIRRVIDKLKREDSGQLQLVSPQTKQDRGFKVFKLQSSNFTLWNSENPENAEKLSKQLEMHVDHILPGRTQDDILYEILLKSGFPLTTKIENLTLAGLKVHSIQNGDLFICLEKSLTLKVIHAMADKKPARVVCLDEGFAGNDQLKTNAVQTFKSKGITFRTV